MQPILERLNDVDSYHPLSAETFGDWSMEAGDVVKVVRGDNEYDVPIHSSTLVWRGKQRMNIDATGKKERDSIARVSAQKYGRGGAALRGQQGMYQHFESEDMSLRSEFFMTYESLRVSFENEINSTRSEFMMTSESLRVQFENEIQSTRSEFQMTSESLRVEFENEIQSTRSEFQMTSESLRVEFENEIQSTRSEFQMTSESLRIEFENEIQSTRSEFQMTSESLRVEFENEIQSTRSEFQMTSDSLRVQFENEIASTRSEFQMTSESLRVEFENEISSTRSEFQMTSESLRVEFESEVDSVRSYTMQTASSWEARVEGVVDPETGEITAASIAVAINNSTGESEAKIDAQRVYVGNTKSTTVIAGKAELSDVTANYIQTKLADLGLVEVNRLSTTNDIAAGSVYGRNIYISGASPQDEPFSVKGFILAAQVVPGTQADTYEFQYKRYGDATWQPGGTFSRATSGSVVVLSGVWSGITQTYTVTANDPDQTEVQTTIIEAVETGLSANVARVKVYHDQQDNTNLVTYQDLTMTEDVSNQRVNLTIDYSGTTLTKAQVSTANTFAAGANTVNIVKTYDKANSRVTFTRSVGSAGTKAVRVGIKSSGDGLGWDGNVFRYQIYDYEDSNEGTNIENAIREVNATSRFQAGQNDVTIVKGSWSAGVVNFTKSAGTQDTETVRLTQKTTWTGNVATVEIWDGTAADVQHGSDTGYTVTVNAGDVYTAGFNSARLLPTWGTTPSTLNRLTINKSQSTSGTYTFPKNYFVTCDTAVVWDAGTNKFKATPHAYCDGAERNTGTTQYSGLITIVPNGISGSGTSGKRTVSVKNGNDVILTSDDITDYGDGYTAGRNAVTLIRAAWSGNQTTVKKNAGTASTVAIKLSLTGHWGDPNTEISSGTYENENRYYWTIKDSGSIAEGEACSAAKNNYINAASIRTKGRNDVKINKGAWSAGVVNFTKSTGTADTKTVQLVAAPAVWNTSTNKATVQIWDGTAADAQHGSDTGYTVTVDASARYSAGYSSARISATWGTDSNSNRLHIEKTNSTDGTFTNKNFIITTDLGNENIQWDADTNKFKATPHAYCDNAERKTGTTKYTGVIAIQFNSLQGAGASAYRTVSIKNGSTVIRTSGKLLDYGDGYTEGVSAGAASVTIDGITAAAIAATAIKASDITLTATTSAGVSGDGPDKLSLSRSTYTPSGGVATNCVNLKIGTKIIGRISTQTVYNAGGATAHVDKESQTLAYGGSIKVSAQYTNASGSNVNTGSSCTITAPTDANIKAGNIKQGITIFGVTGTYAPTGIITSINGTAVGDISTDSDNPCNITATGTNLSSDKTVKCFLNTGSWNSSGKLALNVYMNYQNSSNMGTRVIRKWLSMPSSGSWSWSYPSSTTIQASFTVIGKTYTSTHAR